jgi:Protein of unknown function (DUF3617)
MRIAFSLVTLLASAVVLAAADLPRRKSGLWEVSMTVPKMPEMRFQECVDQKNDDMFKPPNPGDEDISCSKVETRREGAGWVMNSVCKMEGTTATTRSVFTGNFESAFKAEHKSTYSPPLEGMREVTMTMNARWTGPCKPGQKPGEVDIPGMPSKKR